jgi:hypothetical protein
MREKPKSDVTTDLSNTFLSCNLRFFSSAFVEDVDGPAEDKDSAALGMVTVVLARFAGRWEDNSSSSCARNNGIQKYMNELCE